MLNKRGKLGYFLATLAILLIGSLFMMETPATADDIPPLPTYDPISYIVGGENAEKGEFPFIVEINIRFSPTQGGLCGGSIINAEWILTAAHCVVDSSSGSPVPYSPSQFLVLAGQHIRSNPVASDVQIIGVSQVIPHPNYTPGPELNDIALLKLSNRVTFVPDLVEPVRLLDPAKSLPVGAPSIVAGWGRLVENGDLPATLQKVTVNIISQANCNTNYQANGYNIVDSMVCAGVAGGGKDACQGDSGGPLFRNGSDNNWTQVGVVSFGIGCARAEFPGVYARVSSYINWIQQYAAIELDAPEPINFTFSTWLPQFFQGATFFTNPIGSNPTPVPQPTATTPPIVPTATTGATIPTATPAPATATPAPMNPTATPDPTGLDDVEVFTPYLEYSTDCGTEADDFDFDSLTAPSNSKWIYGEVFIAGAQGVTATTEWYYQGSRIDGMTETTVITDEFAFAEDTIYGDLSGDRQCGSNLPVGSYEFVVLLNNVEAKRIPITITP